MTAQERNQKALDFLSRQDWKSAQALFFENAKTNPSHQTFNNLGFYLVSEGLICKNGQHRNALKLGFQYLDKASRIKKSATNYAAMVEALNYELRKTSKEHAGDLYKKSYFLLNKAIQIDYTNPIKYNVLRFS